MALPVLLLLAVVCSVDAQTNNGGPNLPHVGTSRGVHLILNSSEAGSVFINGVNVLQWMTDAQDTIDRLSASLAAGGGGAEGSPRPSGTLGGAALTSFSDHLLLSSGGFSEVDRLLGDLLVEWYNIGATLGPFGELQAVGRNLAIVNCSINATTGAFDTLVSVGGSLDMSGNSDLQMVDTFRALASIGENLRIYENDGLQHLRGAFEGLEQVGRAVLISGMGQLAEIGGFGRLNRVGHNPNGGQLTQRQHPTGVIIQQNGMLTEVDAFHNVSDFTGIFSVISNPSLERVNVFAGATRTVFSRHPGLTNTDSYSSPPAVELHSGHDSDGVCALQDTLLNNIYNQCFSASSLGDASIQISGNPSLTTVAGLGGLTEMGGSISISANDNLQVVPACESLTRSNGSVIIYANPALTELSSFTALVEVNGSVIVESNAALTRIADAAYGSLATVGGDLVLRDCAALSVVSRFSSLERVGGSLVLDGIGLSSVSSSDMSRLREVGRVFLVANMSSLSNILGPSSTSLPRVTIVANPALVAIDGFPAVQTMGGDQPPSAACLRRSFWPDVRGLNTPQGAAMAPTGALSVVGNAALMSIRGFASVTTISVPGPSFACGNYRQRDSASGQTILRGSSNCTSSEAVASGLPSYSDTDSGMFGGALFHDAMPFWAVYNRYVPCYYQGSPDRADEFINASRYSPAILIDGNDQLASIGALQSLLRVDGDVAITNNANLRRLDAFSSLRVINGSLSIAHNDVLADISGFSSLEEVHGHFRLIDSSNSSVPNGPGWTAGFGSLRKVYGTLTFAGNVTSFAGVFPNLECAGHVQCGVLRQRDGEEISQWNSRSFPVFDFVTPYFNSTIRYDYYNRHIPRGYQPSSGKRGCPAAWQNLPACE
jgi:hypothetical protein